MGTVAIVPGIVQRKDRYDEVIRFSDYVNEASAGRAGRRRATLVFEFAGAQLRRGQVF
jgi:hypothetical protein